MKLWFTNLQFAPILSLSIMLGISLLLAVTFAVITLIPCASKIEKMSV